MLWIEVHGPDRRPVAGRPRPALRGERRRSRITPPTAQKRRALSVAIKTEFLDAGIVASSREELAEHMAEGQRMPLEALRPRRTKDALVRVGLALSLPPDVPLATLPLNPLRVLTEAVKDSENVGALSMAGCPRSALWSVRHARH
jgi:hypothetical protein